MFAVLVRSDRYRKIEHLFDVWGTYQSLLQIEHLLDIEWLCQGRRELEYLFDIL